MYINWLLGRQEKQQGNCSDMFFLIKLKDLIMKTTRKITATWLMELLHSILFKYFEMNQSLMNYNGIHCSNSRKNEPLRRI